MSEKNGSISSVPLLLTRSGRRGVSVAFNLAGIVVILGALIGSTSTEVTGWVRAVAFYAPALVGGLLLSVGVYLWNSRVSLHFIAANIAVEVARRRRSVGDEEIALQLYEAARLILEDSVHRLGSDMRKWLAVVVRSDITFRDMNPVEKAVVIAFVLIGVVLITAGAADLLTSGLPLHLQMGSKLVAVQRWQSGLAFVFLGLAWLFFASRFRVTRVTDRWEEGLRELKEDLGIK